MVGAWEQEEVGRGPPCHICYFHCSCNRKQQTKRKEEDDERKEKRKEKEEGKKRRKEFRSPSPMPSFE